MVPPAKKTSSTFVFALISFAIVSSAFIQTVPLGAWVAILIVIFSSSSSPAWTPGAWCRKASPEARSAASAASPGASFRFMILSYLSA